MKKVQWNSIDIKQNGLKYSKNDESSTLPQGKSNKIQIKICPKLVKHHPSYYNDYRAT